MNSFEISSSGELSNKLANLARGEFATDGALCEIFYKCTTALLVEFVFALTQIGRFKQLTATDLNKRCLIKKILKARKEYWNVY